MLNFIKTEIKHTKGVIRLCKSKNDRQHKKVIMAKRKRTNNNLQNTAQKTKDRATQTPLKTLMLRNG